MSIWLEKEPAGSQSGVSFLEDALKAFEAFETGMYDSSCFGFCQTIPKPFLLETDVI